MTQFSQRTDWPTATNLLIWRIEEKKRSGVPLIDLTESNPTHCGFGFFNRGWLEPFSDEKNLSYTPDPHGLLEARQAVSAYYAGKNINVLPEQVFLTASTSEAYDHILRLLCDPRDRVAIPSPGYPLFDCLAALADVDISRYLLLHDQDMWRISAEGIRAAFGERLKALVLVNPNNPTGNFVKPSELEVINERCRETGTAIISDEVFLDFGFHAEGVQPLSLAQNHEVLTFTLSGISKILALPQMKISWIVVSGPETLRRKAIERLEIIADAYLSVNTPSQHALGAWLGACGRVQREILERLAFNRAALFRRFQEDSRVQVLPCEGGWYAVLEIRSGRADEELAMELLENNNIIIHPGYFFDFEKGNFLVLSLLLQEKIFQKGIDRFWAGLNHRKT
ncbi:MAG: pyridoxal phosphate-dependent aminotransferase [Candidatus Omnitrophica bacterium CG07_land_8_20_14_0_80_50_8]|nr:MAG: pyridoxal phosphate-dependent aminotransferase [Candidatus Omnitrophica bacterium CG07_land_8_20_14_0_80_50_8]